MTGTKKANRIFIDSKVPAFERELWPIVQDAQDIIWIPGLVRSAKAELTKQSSRMITISVKNLEED
jgi:tRNA(Ile)-lysidine synthase